MKKPGIGTSWCALLVLVFGQSALAADACVRMSQARYASASADLMPFFGASADSKIRVIVGFRRKVSALHAESSVPGRIIHRLGIVNSVAAEVPAAELEKLVANPDVRVLELDGKVTALDADPVAPQASMPDELRTKQVVPPGITRTAAPEVWRATTGKNVKVAVIDTGIDYDHPDLADRVVGGVNYAGGDRAAWSDGHGHGTHVAGIIAADNNDIGVVGMAPQASLSAVKVLDDAGNGNYSDVVAGVEHAIDQRADVANMSLGGTSDLQTLHDALREAQSNGVLVTAAAGNSGEENGNPLNYPGAYAEVVSVGAVDGNDIRAPFSTYNKFVTLVAPGVGVLSLDRGNKYIRRSGTSMAAPHVAGAAALLKQAFPNESLYDLKRRLVCNASALFPRSRNVWTGYGLVNVKQAIAQAATGRCEYLAGPVTRPERPEPERYAEPHGNAHVIYVKSTGLKLINDGEHRQLLVTMKLVDEKGHPQKGLKVSSEIMEYSVGPLGSATARTNGEGEARFVLKGFSCGAYLASVKGVENAAFSRGYGQPSAMIDLDD